LSDIGQRWTIDQQAKPLKYRMSKSAPVGKFQSIGLNVTMPLAGMVHAKHQVTTQIRIDVLPLARFGKWDAKLSSLANQSDVLSAGLAIDLQNWRINRQIMLV
jgi:hypothetical protein